MKLMLKQVLERTVPSEQEKKSEKKLAKEIIGKIRAMEGKHIGVAWAGSSARNTHLKGDRDLDIFVLFSRGLGRREFEKEGLRIGKAIFKGHEWEKAYSEHPYIRGVINGFEVEIVPSYKISNASQKQSSVDRSILHNLFLKKRLSKKLCNETRLLRQFFKGIGSYGAEIKTSSVPGYVVELLVLKYKSFKGAIKAISKWVPGTIIDIEKYYAPKEAREKFPGHLAIIDPVDKNRNVAAALSLEQFERIVAAANAFLKKPSMKFFFPEKTIPFPIEKIRKILQKKELIGIEIAYPKGTLPDIAWGQIKRIGCKIAKQLDLAAFKASQTAEWSDEKNSIVFLFELESLLLQKAEKRIGPLASMKEHSEKFLRAHPKPLSGPRIEKGRWVLETEREFTSAEKFLETYLKILAKEESGDIAKAIKKRTVILHEKNLLALYSKNKEFAEFLTSYLKGKESFL
ncbi:MAG: CCA tRNA nucleotidyltransferase [Candidatus ainarchaeum sp.]|nr:CCA tRNA nucleotidyltransferase [Candidatus ainarchaeum sp.]